MYKKALLYKFTNVQTRHRNSSCSKKYIRKLPFSPKPEKAACQWNDNYHSNYYQRHNQGCVIDRTWPILSIIAPAKKWNVTFVRNVSEWQDICFMTYVFWKPIIMMFIFLASTVIELSHWNISWIILM